MVDKLNTLKMVVDNNNNYVMIFIMEGEDGIIMISFKDNKLGNMTIE